VYIFSASFSSVNSLGTGFLPRPSVVCVCLSVRKVYCGKMADWIRIPFGVVSGVGRGIGVLDGVQVPQGKGGVGHFVNRHFQAKRAKYSNVHIMETTVWIPTKFCLRVKTTKYASWLVQ